MRYLGTFIIGIAITAGLSANSAEIVAIKENRVLIDLAADEVASASGHWVITGADGKPQGILLVEQIKGRRALAKLVKGQVAKEDSLQKTDNPDISLGDPENAAVTTAPAGNPVSPVAAAKPAAPGPKKPRRRQILGVLGGVSLNSMSAKPGGTSVALSGTSYSLVAHYQTWITGKYYLFANAGYLPLVAENDKYNVDVTYLGLAGEMHYRFYQKNPWSISAGAGVGFLYPVTASSNIIETSKMTITTTLDTSLAILFSLAHQSYIPVQLGYSMRVDNSNSTANQIILRAGWARTF